SFIEHSPFQIVNEGTTTASPERLFDVFTSGEGQRDWFKDFVALRWTSSEPYGVGSTREIELKIVTVKERFLVWDRAKRATFVIYASTLPLTSAMVEDLRIDAPSGGKTRFTWTVHYRPTLLMRPLHPIARMIFGNMFSTSAKGLARWTSDHP